jgi:hypothetical protein
VSHEFIVFQGVLFIQNAQISKIIYEGKTMAISIKCEGRKKTEYIALEANQTHLDWYKALEKASKWHEEERKRAAAPLTYRNILDIAPDTKLSQSIISRAYRKLCLKVNFNLPLPITN